MKSKKRRLPNFAPAAAESRGSAERRAAGSQNTNAIDASWGGREWILLAAIVALTFMVFFQLRHAEFLNFDDNEAVTSNPEVLRGLTLSSIRWAFTSTAIGYYPLTWLSHQACISAFGLNAGFHHFTNVALHAVSAALLFFALFRFTAAPLRSAAVAALFAIHPMHVESVAWIAERKDTLSTPFGMLALIAYAFAARTSDDSSDSVSDWKRRIRAGRGAMWVAAGCLACSMLAKQMLITLPIILLALDHWPLRRQAAIGQRLIEKLPLFAVAAAGALLAVTGQRGIGAVQSLASFPIGLRIGNAIVAYCTYTAKLLWPSRLAIYYPLVDQPPWLILLCGTLLVAITWLAWHWRNRAPYFIVGWAWFIVTLSPVIGIVQIGWQGMADRYTYVPAIGLFIILVWGGADLAGRASFPPSATAAAAIAWILILAGVAHAQARYWRDSARVLQHAVDVTGPNPVAEYNLGQALLFTKPDQAVPHLRRAIQFWDDMKRARPNAQPSPVLAEAHFSIASARMRSLEQTGSPEERLSYIDEARAEYRAGLSSDPNNSAHRRDLALADLARANVVGKGATPIERLLNAGAKSSREGKHDEAVEQLLSAVELEPELAETHVYLAIALLRAGRNAEAARQLRAAAKIDAVKANRYLTRALRLRESDNNLNDLVARLEAR